MKITDFITFKIAEDKHKFIDQLLHKRLFNNHIFEHEFLIVKTEIDGNNFDDMMSLIYRRYWEESYLRRNLDDFRYWSLDKTDIVMSIDECLKFLDAAIPPVFRSKMKEIQSVNSVIETMKCLLCEPNDQQLLNISVFKKILHMNRNDFDDVTSPLTDAKIAKLCKMNKDIITQIPMVTVDVYHGSFQDILNSDEKQPIMGDVQLTFFFHKIEHNPLMLQSAVFLFLELQSTHIINLSLDDHGLYVSCYLNELPTSIQNNIKLCYRWIGK